MSDLKWSDIKISALRSNDKKVAAGLHRFRSKDAAKKYLERMLTTALQDAWNAGVEFGDRSDSSALCEYIQGNYGFRIDAVVNEMTRLEINERLRKI